MDQAGYIEVFNSLQPNQTGTQQIQNQVNSPSKIALKTNNEEEESRIKKLEKMIRKKLLSFLNKNEVKIFNPFQHRCPCFVFKEGQT